MARQQSNIESIDLAGSLAATLTPRVPHASGQAPRSHQNSGLFDVGALYAETFRDVMQRAQPAPRFTPLSRAAEPAWPIATRWPQPLLSLDFDEAPIEFARSSAVPRSRGVGWFGIAVAWLATVTTAAVITIGVPAHAPTHARLPAVGAPAVMIPAAPQVVIPATPQVATPAPVTEAPPPAAIAPAVAAPVAVRLPPAIAAAALPASAVVPAKKATIRAAVSAVAHGRPAPAVAATAAAPAPAAAPAIAATSHAAPPPKPAAASVSTAGMSLDDLIRHEVQIESAKHR
jgi:hypothetical protein